MDPAPAPAIVADVMRPALTTADQDDHAAAAAYLMKHAGASALIVLQAHTGQPMGIITEKDIAHAVADGKDLEQTRSRTRKRMTRMTPTRTPANRAHLDCQNTACTGSSWCHIRRARP
jgi:CBS domain-containing protein